jgi:hypothetical protein
VTVIVHFIYEMTLPTLKFGMKVITPIVLMCVAPCIFVYDYNYIYILFL